MSTGSHHARAPLGFPKLAWPTEVPKTVEYSKREPDCFILVTLRKDRSDAKAITSDPLPMSKLPKALALFPPRLFYRWKFNIYLKEHHFLGRI